MLYENCRNCKHFFYEYHDESCRCTLYKFTVTSEIKKASDFVCDSFEQGELVYSHLEHINFRFADKEGE